MRTAAAALLLLIACRDDRGAAARPPLGDGPIRDRPPAVDAAPPPDPGFVGVLVASEQVDIAPRFAGRIVTVRVRAGDQVPAGALIAEMDPAPLREEVRAAEAAARASSAAYRQAEVDLREANRRLEIERASVAAGTSARQVLEAAEMAVQRERAAKERAGSLVAEERSRLETARAHLADSELRSPFAGTIALRFRDAGATVAAGAPIVRVVGKGELWLRFAVPPDRARNLAVGATVSAEVDTLGAAAPAVVRQISPALDPASGMVLAEAELSVDPSVRAGLRPGLAARVKPR